MAARHTLVLFDCLFGFLRNARYDSDTLAITLAISNLSVLVLGVYFLLRSCTVTSETDFLEAGFVEDVFSPFPIDRKKALDEYEKGDYNKSYIEMLYLGGGKAANQASPRGVRNT